MNEELWKSCQSGTLDSIAKSQLSRNARRSWVARSFTVLLFLIIPSILLIGLFKPASISCQQAMQWFDPANNEHLTTPESRSFRMHLLFCSKCRNSYVDFQKNAQVSVISWPQDAFACYPVSAKTLTLSLSPAQVLND